MAIIVVIAGITYYAASNAYEQIKKDKTKKGWYFIAFLSGVGVYIDIINPISQQQATARIARGQSIYTFSGSNARVVVLNTGFGCMDSSEIDTKMIKGNIYYYHWHVKNRLLPSHAWFGRPYTK